VAAHWPGIEQAPAAIRAAGLIDRLRAADPDVVDYGDRPVARWVADRSDDRPNAWRHVVDVLADARMALGSVFDAGHRPLILGGECTVVIALVAAAVERFDDVGLVYVDGGQDLMIPTDHPEEPILDAMGVAHLLDLPGCVPELAAFGARRPLLRPADVVFVGYGDEEEDVHGLVPSMRIRAPEVVLDPEAAAFRASAALDHRQVVVHVDVDVVDAFDLPLADIATYGRGVRLDHLIRFLTVMLSDPRVVGMTLAEANPDHDTDGSSIARLVAALIGALSRAGGSAEGRRPAGPRSAR
jgi:arginase